MISEIFMRLKFSIRRTSKLSVKRSQISIPKAYEKTKQKSNISDEERPRDFEKKNSKLSVDRYSILSKNQSNLKSTLFLSHAETEPFRERNIALFFRILAFLRILTTFLLITEEEES